MVLECDEQTSFAQNQTNQTKPNNSQLTYQDKDNNSLQWFSRSQQQSQFISVLLLFRMLFDHIRSSCAIN